MFKKFKQTIMLAAMALGITNDVDVLGLNQSTRKEEVESRKKEVIPAGCKRWSFYGETCIALNEKSARRKCATLRDNKYLKDGGGAQG